MMMEMAGKIATDSERAAATAGHFASVGMWMIGVCAISAWYVNALAGALPVAVPMQAKILPEHWGITAVEQLRFNGVWQIVFFSAACVFAHRSAVRSPNASWVIFAVVVTLLTTAFPWLVIQGRCAVWEPLAFLPTLIVLRSADGPTMLRVALGTVTASFWLAMVLGLQPGLIAVVVPATMGVLTAMAAQRRYFDLLSVRLIRHPDAEPGGSPEVDFPPDAAVVAPVHLVGLGVSAGAVIFVTMLPVADWMVGHIPTADPAVPDATFSPLAALTGIHRPLTAGADPFAPPLSRDPFHGPLTTSHSGPNDRSDSGDPSGEARGGSGRGDRLPRVRRSGVLGFSRDMRFGDQTGGAGEVPADDAVVFTVEVVPLPAGMNPERNRPLPTPPPTPSGTAADDDDDAASDATAATVAMPVRWQTDALAVYVDGRWERLDPPSETLRKDADDGRADQWVEHPWFAVADQAVVYRLRVYPIADRMCPAPYPVGAVRASAMTIANDGLFRFAGDVSRTGVKYDVWPGRFVARSPVPSADYVTVASEIATAAEFAEWLAPIHDAVLQLRDRDVFAAATLIAGNFSHGFAYELSPALDPADDPNLAFLRKKRGYCQHFASAFVLGCRLLGIPARVAVGFAGGIYDDDRQRMIVRGTDAHAWGQIYVAGAGWVDIDPLLVSAVPEAVPDVVPLTPPSEPRPSTVPEMPDRPSTPTTPLPRPPSNRPIQPSNRPPTPTTPPVEPSGPDSPPPVEPAPPPSAVRAADPDFPDPPDGSGFDPRQPNSPPSATHSTASTTSPRSTGSPTSAGANAGAGESPETDGTAGAENDDAAATAADDEWAEVSRPALIAGVVGVAVSIVAVVWWTQRRRRRRAAEQAARPRPNFAGLPWEFIEGDVASAWAQIQSLENDRERVIATWHLWARIMSETYTDRRHGETAPDFADRLVRSFPPLVPPEWPGRLAGFTDRFEGACYGPWPIDRPTSDAALTDGRFLSTVSPP